MRIINALFDGLTKFHPLTLEPMAALGNSSIREPAQRMQTTSTTSRMPRRSIEASVNLRIWGAVALQCRISQLVRPRVRPHARLSHLHC